MIIYWLLWVGLCLANIFSSYRGENEKLFFYFTALIFFLFIGFRYQVGGDWYNYLYFYDLIKYSDLKSIFLGGDPAYNLLNYWGNKLGFTDTILVNAICGFLVIYFLSRLALNLKNYWLVFLVYFPYHLIVVSAGYTRQSVAIAACTYSIFQLFEKKLLNFFILVVFAALFHKTAIIFLIFYPILILNKIKNYKILCDIYLLLSFIILVVFLYYFSLQDENIYLQGNEEISSKGFFIRWLYHLIPLFIFYKYKNNYKSQLYYPLINYFGYLVLFMFPLGVFFSTLADRFNLYLIFFDIFILCTAFNFFTEKSKKMLLMMLVLFYSIQMFLWFFYGEWAMKAWVPYQNYISNYLLHSVF